MSLWDTTRNAAARYAHLPSPFMRFMAVVKEKDGELDDFAKRHEQMGVLACCALDNDGVRAYAERLADLQVRAVSGELTSPQAFAALLEIDQKYLPKGVQEDLARR